MADNSELLIENSEKEKTIPKNEEKQEANEEVASEKTSCENQRAAGWLQSQQTTQTSACPAAAAAAAAGGCSRRDQAAKKAKKKGRGSIRGRRATARRARRAAPASKITTHFAQGACAIRGHTKTTARAGKTRSVRAHTR